MRIEISLNGEIVDLHHIDKETLSLFIEYTISGMQYDIVKLSGDPEANIKSLKHYQKLALKIEEILDENTTGSHEIEE